MVTTILLVFAFVCFCLSATWVYVDPHRWRLIAAGLAFWVLAILLGGLHIPLR